MKTSITKIAKELGLAVLPDNKTHTNRLEIASQSSDRIYIVAQRKTEGTHKGQWECSCMGWIRHRHCKHLSSMMPTLQLVGKETKTQKALTE
jgi:hypothetical protein